MGARAGARKRQEQATRGLKPAATDLKLPAAGLKPAAAGFKPAAAPALVRDAGDVEFDRLVYGRVRLGILSALAVSEPLAFNDLKSLFQVTDGNLSAHARKLEDAGYITCRKSFKGRRPRSEYRLTSAGRKAL
ncbi:MAG: winged helix-turn-helix domain-containing protein, partial [Steroidobacteraceae bacterium]